MSLLPSCTILWIKAAPATALARRQQRALPWEARPAHAGPRREIRQTCTAHPSQSGVSSSTGLPGSARAESCVSGIHGDGSPGNFGAAVCNRKSAANDPDGKRRLPMIGFTVFSKRSRSA